MHGRGGETMLLSGVLDAVADGFVDVLAVVTCLLADICRFFMVLYMAQSRPAKITASAVFSHIPKVERPPIRPGYAAIV